MKNFIKTVGVTSCLVAAMGTTQALSQTRYPDWASNGPALIGAKNGIAPLDANGYFSGILSNSTSVVAPNATRGLSDKLFKDEYNLADYGAILSGSDASMMSSINSAMQFIPEGASVKIPCSSWWPNSPKKNGNAWSPTTSSWYVYDATACPLMTYDSWPSPSPLNSYIGDGSPYIYNNANGRWISRYDSTFTGNPLINIQYANTLDLKSDAGTSALRLELWNGLGFTESTSISNHINVGIDLNLQDYRNDAGDYGISGDTAEVVRMNKFFPGSNTWAFAFELDDWSGHTPTAQFAQTNEIDLQGNGEDSSNSVFDPRASKRRMLYFGIASRSSGWSMRSYTASTKYAVGDMIIVTVGGTQTVFVVTTPGTTGTSSPNWGSTTKEYDTVTDGTVVWTRGAKKDLTVGVGIWFNQNSNDNSSFNTGISGNQIFNNAFIDTTEMTAVQKTIFRIGGGQYIDWSGKNLDGASVNSGQNLHMTGYNTSSGEFEYLVNGTKMFSVNDTGELYRSSAQITATGTTISDSAVSTGYPMVYIVGGPAHAGIRVPVDLARLGHEITYRNLTNVNIFIYPIDGGWWFNVGWADPGKPIVIHPRESVSISYDPTGGTLLGVVRHGNVFNLTSTYANLGDEITLNPKMPAKIFCSDCYSKLRESGDTSTGIEVYWNGSRWNDALGLEAQH